MNNLVNYLQDGFVFFKERESVDSILGDRLIIDSKRLGETIDYIRRKKIKSITINSSYYLDNDLNFLKEVKDEIKGVFLLKSKIDTSAINLLHNLRVLRGGRLENDLDCRNFPELEVLGINYSKFFKNINDCKKLFWLNIDGVKSKDLHFIDRLENLKFLYLDFSAIESLDGIQDLIRLKFLRLHAVSKLKSLNGLNANMTDLEVLDIYGARSLSDYSAIGHLFNLRKLYLVNTGDSPSLFFLNSLDQLNTLHFNFKVENGEISIPPSVTDIYLKDYPGHNLKLKEIKKC